MDYQAGARSLPSVRPLFFCLMNDKQDLLLAYGGEIKTTSEGMISGYLVRFTSANEPDLEGDYFDGETQFDLNGRRPISVYYNHGTNKTLGAEPIGQGEISMTDVGVWLEGELDLHNAYVAALHQRMITKGKTGFSSGAVGHLVRREQVGEKTFHITRWPLGEASITPTPAAGPELTRVIPFKSWQEANHLQAELLQASGDDATDDATDQGADTTPINSEVNNMSDQATLDIGAIAKQVAAELKAEQDAAAKVVADQKAHDEQVARDAVKAFQQELEKQAAVNDPGFAGKGVNVHLDGDTRKYDNTDTGDLAVVASVISSAHGLTYRQNSPAIVKALARRMDSAEHREDEYVKKAEQAMKMAGIKANETDFSTNASYGDEWIGVAYSGALWESIRLATPVVNRLGGFEFPAGAESLVLPLESTDPIWYKVAQAGDPSTALTRVANTVTASGLGTANNTMTLAKLGAAVNWTGEMAEDAVLPFAAQLRRQIALSGGEYLESAIIDGDTATTASTNINDIAGTPAGTDYFLVWNGFRKSPLVTTTANSRDGGALASSDYLATVKLMGGSGINALDRSKVSFIIDPATHYKSLELADVKSRDVFGGATIESGQLSSIFGYEVFISGHMNKMSAVRLANSAGKVDQDTTGNNTTGSILAVRWDQWAFGYRRRMSMEVERVPRSDSWEITAMLRAGLLQRDTEASAISYNLTV